jgi:hypothetical protein
MTRIGMEWCKNLKCHFVCNKYTTLVEHMMMEHNKRWDYKDDMNPFWKLMKYNLEENLNNMSWTMISKRRNIWFSNEGTYENIENVQTEESDKQGSLSLNAEDEDGFHLQVTEARKLGNVISIIDLTAENKESIRTKSVKKFIIEDKRIEKRTIKSAMEGLIKEKDKRSKTPDKKWYKREKVSDSDSEDEERSKELEKKAMEGVQYRKKMLGREPKRAKETPYKEKKFDNEGYEKKVSNERRKMEKPLQRKGIPKRPNQWQGYKMNAHRLAGYGFLRKYEVEPSVPEDLKRKMEAGKK